MTLRYVRRYKVPQMHGKENDTEVHKKEDDSEICGKKEHSDKH
jgi:hypothetical protein